MKNRTVLVVDDDTAQRVFLAFDLLDFELLEASSLSEGYAMAVESVPDAIVVDRRLQDGDGLDLVRRIRRNSKLVQVPVFVVTAAFDEADRVAVMRAGADAYIGKPLNSGDLESKLLELLATDPEQRRPERMNKLSRVKAGLPEEEQADSSEQSRAHWYSRRQADAT